MRYKKKIVPPDLRFRGGARKERSSHAAGRLDIVVIALFGISARRSLPSFLFIPTHRCVSRSFLPWDLFPRACGFCLRRTDGVLLRVLGDATRALEKWSKAAPAGCCAPIFSCHCALEDCGFLFYYSVFADRGACRLESAVSRVNGCFLLRVVMNNKLDCCFIIYVPVARAFLLY